MERIYGRKLKDGDFIFPAITKTGQPKMGGGSVTKTFMDNLLVEMVAKCGLMSERRGQGKFTTHCWRRGGAQYRFMFADVRWSLTVVTWWGGWAKGEKLGAITRYLLEEFSRYEEGYGDMLDPDRNPERHHLYLGGSDVAQPEVPASLQPLLQQFDNLKLDVKQEIRGTILGLTDRLFAQMEETLASHRPIISSIALTPSSVSASASASTEIPIRSNISSSISAPLIHSADPTSPPTESLTPPLIPAIKHWPEAVEQWERGDRDRGLWRPLKDWPTEWTKAKKGGVSNSLVVLYQQRKMIVDELMEEFEGNAQRMALTYPNNQKISETLSEIRKNRQERGLIKTRKRRNTAA